MENLPMDILENILDRLPADETALRAKQVCKTWRILLRCKTDKIGFLITLSYPSPALRKKNKLIYSDYERGESKYSYRYDAVDDNEIYIPGNSYIDGMLGSCNGLVCFRRQADYRVIEPFIICNPLTGETVYVPYTYTGGNTPMGGFGYCHTTNEYKIVRMFWDCNKERKNYHVQVYTLGCGGGWRNKSINFEKAARNKSIRICPEHSAGVYANGAIHWLHESYATEEDYTIAAFDMEDETFEFIQCPSLKNVRVMYRNNHPPRLLGGSNLYLVSTIPYEPYCTDIWAYKRRNTNTTNGGSCGLKENYKDINAWHWIKEFRIEWEEPHRRKLHLSYVEPFAITRKNEFLFHCYGALYCYELNTSTLYTLLDECDYTGRINVILHANSIVSMSPKDLEEVRDRQ